MNSSLFVLHSSLTNMTEKQQKNAAAAFASDGKAGDMRRVNTEDYVESNCSMTRKFSSKKSEFL